MFSDGSLDYTTNLMPDLDNSQVAVLFRHFCYQFWNKAEKECVGKEEHTVDAAPLDIYPPVKDSCDFQYLMSVWGKETENAQVSTSLLKQSQYLKFTNFSNSHIVSLLSGADASLVRSLKQRGNKVFASDNDSFINSIQTSDGVWLIPKIDAASEEEVHAVLLNSTQKGILNKHLIRLAEKGLNEYIDNDIRENLNGKNIFHLGNSVSQKYKIIPKSTVKPVSVKPSELIPQDDFEKFKPGFTDDGRSVFITYEWTIIPYTLPPGSKEHQLYKDWTDTENKIIAYIDTIENDMVETENKKNIFSRFIDRLFVAKQQNFSGNRRDLENLKNLNITKYSLMEKSLLEEKIKRLNEICVSVKNDSSDLSEANRKEELKEKIKNQKEEKKKNEDKLVVENKKLQEKEKDAKNQSDELEKLKKQYKEKKDEDDREVAKEVKKLNDLKVEKDKIASEIDSLENISKKDADDKMATAGEKEKREAEEAIKKQSAILEEFRKQAAKRNDENEGKIKEEDRKIKDLNVEKTRIDNEITSLENKIKELDKDVQSLSDELKNPAKETSKKESVLSGLSGGGKKANQPGQTRELDVPHLDMLPSTGKLYTHDGQDYLAIVYWEEYNEGKEEAGRLKAKLCAEGGKNG
jgi:hypothetical protein